VALALGRARASRAGFKAVAAIIPVQALLAARGQVEVGLALGALGGDVVVRHTGIALQGGARRWRIIGEAGGALLDRIPACGAVGAPSGRIVVVDAAATAGSTPVPLACARPCA